MSWLSRNLAKLGTQDWFLEGASNRVFEEGIIIPKTGVTNYIRASYTGDASTDITITWAIRYAPKTATAVITAV